MKKAAIILTAAILTVNAYSQPKTVLTKGNISAGKFYIYNTETASPYEDELPTKWSSGSKLTDEKLFDYPAIENLVAFKTAEPVEIVLDLGKTYKLDKISISCPSTEKLLITKPDEIRVSVSTDKEKWEPAGMQTIKNTDDEKSRFDFETQQQARFVKYELIQNAKKTVAVDEIEVEGTIENVWRLAPEEGCYHGAFPPAYGFSKETRQGRNGMMLDTFEELVGKKLSMVLWYQGMAPGRDFDEIQKWRADNLCEDYDGCRLMMYGWLPTISSKRIAEGELDEFFEQYFKDSIDPEKLNGIDDPLFIRPMNEFNSTWIPYGLDPENFKKAWRRMYSIAEQIGAAQKHIFVWAVNHRSYPNEPWNNMDNYYPGDNYVDWVGISCYPPSLRFVGSEEARYPRERLKEFYDLYADRKPLCIAEGGFSDSTDKAKWVKEWFTTIKEDYPAIKAFIWENHYDRVIQSDEKALEIYRNMVQDDYWY
jgi:hypothetical protein